MKLLQFSGFEDGDHLNTHDAIIDFVVGCLLNESDNRLGKEMCLISLRIP